MMALTVWSDKYSPMQLKRIVNQGMSDELKAIKEVSEVTVIGGAQRQIRVDLDPVALAGYHLSPCVVAQSVAGANQQVQAGMVANDDKSIAIQSGSFLSSADDVSALVVGDVGGHAVYLRDVAKVTDGPEDPAQYVSLGVGLHGTASDIDTSRYAPGTEYNAVTVAIAKQQGANAIDVSHAVKQKILSGAGNPSLDHDGVLSFSLHLESHHTVRAGLFYRYSR
jgi:multidrug efflux pump subunit AcrB